MKVMVKNLGPLKQAEFTLGDLTIICGKNNCGKTYATYALYGFLTLWKESLSIHVDHQKIQKLLSEGTIGLDIHNYIKNAQEILDRACVRFSREISQVFSSAKKLFADTSFRIEMNESDLKTRQDYQYSSGTMRNQLFAIERKGDSPIITVSLLVEKESIRIPVNYIAQMIGDSLKDVLFGLTFPRAQISSTERTGAAIFRNELDFARNRLLEEMAKQENGIDPMDLLLKTYSTYAMPVTRNVDFTRSLEESTKNESYIAQNHSGILNDFSDLIGGEYVAKRGQLYFVPKKTNIRLIMNESSSSVKSLLYMNFYLRHVAKKGDLLMIDEPELNLHPENQRRLSRLFVRLINVGIKVFITTHSDYFIREFNTMIMLNQNDKRLKGIAEKNGYKQEEMLDAEKVRAYIADKALIKATGNTRRSRCLTFIPAKIDEKYGIEMKSFDSTINNMNRIQDEITWGE